MDCELLSTSSALKAYLDELTKLESEAKLYIDLEGNDLSRRGTLSIITILVENEKKLHLVDVTELQAMAFSTSASNGTTLKSILESEVITKVFFDIRTDSDALFNLYGVRVAGIHDLQLMELAARPWGRAYVNGLAKCIANDAPVAVDDKVEFARVKALGRQLFSPEFGGSYAVFDQRPLSKDMLSYCCQDVALMPALYNTYSGKLCDEWWSRIKAETESRIQASQSEQYNGKGRHMAIAPRGWDLDEDSSSEGDQDKQRGRHINYDEHPTWYREVTGLMEEMAFTRVRDAYWFMVYQKEDDW